MASPRTAEHLQGPPLCCLGARWGPRTSDSARLWDQGVLVFEGLGF